MFENSNKALFFKSKVFGFISFNVSQKNLKNKSTAKKTHSQTEEETREYFSRCCKKILSTLGEKNRSYRSKTDTHSKPDHSFILNQVTDTIGKSQKATLKSALEIQKTEQSSMKMPVLGVQNVLSSKKQPELTSSKEQWQSFSEIKLSQKKNDKIHERLQESAIRRNAIKSDRLKKQMDLAMLEAINLFNEDLVVPKGSSLTKKSSSLIVMKDNETNSSETLNIENPIVVW